MSGEALLGRGDLAGVRLGVSVSDSPDLGRLGLVDGHLRLALGEVTRTMLLSGGRLVYGGHLDPEGYTTFLRTELEQYGRQARTLRVYLAWSEHRRLSLQQLEAAEEDLGLNGDIVYLDAEGNQVARDHERGAEPEPVPPELMAPSLTSLRQHMAEETDARLLIGGRVTGFQGRMPGILEEALYAIEQGRPLYLAGGFGGATALLGARLGLTDTWLPRVDGESLEALAGALDEIEAAAQAAGWRVGMNGLDDDENQRLAASHRPSDLASWVAIGLARRER
jgi:hypothetical protein